MWMGGVPPLGYRAQDRKLVIAEGEAEIVRAIFRRYAELGSVRLLKDELEARGIKSKSWTSAAGRLIGDKPFSRGALYLMLQNRLYRGEIVHKEQLRGTRSQQFCRFLSPARYQSGLGLGQKWTHCQQPLRV
jgi:site-specific DNA recombinase